MYDTTLGRFLQRDPLGYADGLNLYEYAGSNPPNRHDPDGTEIREPAQINCLGYATGEGCFIRPEPGKDSLEGVLKKLGWTCGPKGTASKDCRCKCYDYMLMIYIYKYDHNPAGKDPFKDAWIRKVGQNDYHLIKCDDAPAVGSNFRNCSGGWSDVFGGQPQPGDVTKFKDGDERWKTTPNKNPQQAYCCCKSDFRKMLQSFSVAPPAPALPRPSHPYQPWWNGQGNCIRCHDVFPRPPVR